MAEGGPSTAAAGGPRDRDNVGPSTLQPLHIQEIQGDFSTKNCLHGSYRQGFSTLRIGENILDFVSAPANVNHNEWVAYHLHHLIDRVCVLFDLMKFFCNDGKFKIDFDQPMAYALPVQANLISESDRNAINSLRSECRRRVKVADTQFVDFGDLVLELERTNVVNWTPSSLRTEGTIENDDPNRPHKGASSYIDSVLKSLKNMRADNYFFPRDRDTNFSANFPKHAKFILYHLITILSHYLTCHFDEISRLNIKMHIITLAYCVYCLGEKNTILPPEETISADFIQIMRAARKFEGDNYQVAQQ